MSDDSSACPVRGQIRSDFIDIPTGWAMQREIGVAVPTHDSRCSTVQSQGAFLCDCGAIDRHWSEFYQDVTLAAETPPEVDKPDDDG